MHAVHDFSFDVAQGQLVTLLGANGAGKTSVIRAVSGLIAAPGTIELDGAPLQGVGPHRRVRMGIATVPEGRELFRPLSVTENLMMGAYARKDRPAVRRDLDWILALFPALAAKRRAHAGALSGGQGQMLAIGRALMAAPRLLLMDEPSHGLAPLLVEEIFQLIPRLQQERNLSVLLVEQNAGKALTVASYGYVLEAGTLALEGPTSALRHDQRVRELYLGG
ncbi:MAG: ABC transporter ATP-binding protein [Chloroflexota bacterium]|nr:ABC transporter ATP-binding protein [Chloroflexota bacterium]